MTGASGGQAPTFTAQVILRPARSEPERGPTTAANLADARPDPAAASRARAYFEQAGFGVGDVLGTSFSIEGPLTAFAATFGADAHEVEPLLRGAAGAAELSLDRLPDEVRAPIDSVVVTAKPAFGPWNP